MKAGRRVRAVEDPSLVVVLRDPRPLVYASGGSVADDVPVHVRAASAVRRGPSRLVIVQDDVNVLALHHGPERVEAVLLPAGQGGLRRFEDARGNKSDKMDLEACAALPDGRLVLFGSGSTSARERLVVLESSGELGVVDARELYSRLRQETVFSGSELNLEGALVVGDALRLFQRGNGAPRGELRPVNATGDLSLAGFASWLERGGPAPRLERVVQYDLGQLERASFTFTDAALMTDGRVAFLACAEASPDSVRDGDVLGCRFGVIEDDTARVADIRDAEGRLTALKLEGLESRLDSPSVFDVVVDMDRADEPALIARLEAHGLGLTPSSRDRAGPP